VGWIDTELHAAANGHVAARLVIGPHSPLLARTLPLPEELGAGLPGAGCWNSAGRSSAAADAWSAPAGRGGAAVGGWTDVYGAGRGHSEGEYTTLDRTTAATPLFGASWGLRDEE
jgi:hypothetical protein